LVNGKFIDLEVYSLLKREWHSSGFFTENSKEESSRILINSKSQAFLT